MTTRHSKELFALIRHQSIGSQTVETVDEIILVRFSSFARGSLFLNNDSKNVGGFVNENICFGEYITSRDDERTRSLSNIAEINDTHSKKKLQKNLAHHQVGWCTS